MGETGGNAMGWSVELCGGTHVRRTGDIGVISVVTESAVAAGVRRIEALTGRAARKHGNAVAQLAKAVSAELKAPLEETPERVGALLDDRKRLERELSEAKRRLAMGGGASAGAADGVRTVGDVKLFARAVSGIDIKDLKSLADEGKKQVGSGVVAIVGVTGEGKAGVVVGVTSDLTARFNAVDLVRKGAEALGGKGGGGPPGHGAGGRSGRLQGRRRARSHRERDRRRVTRGDRAALGRSAFRWILALFFLDARVVFEEPGPAAPENALGLANCACGARRSVGRRNRTNASARQTRS